MINYNFFMIILIGASASGKTEISKYLIANYNFKKFVTTTTRPIRFNEKNDIDYHFISEDKFKEDIKNNKFIEYTKYNSNFYGTYKSEINDNAVLIIEINGLKHFKNLNNSHIVSFYLKCDENIRIKRMIERKDLKADIDKRIKNDRVCFNEEISKYCDYTLDSSIKTIKELSDEIYNIYKSKLN